MNRAKDVECYVFLEFESLHLRQRETRTNAGFFFIYAGFQTFWHLHLLLFIAVYLRIKSVKVSYKIIIDFSRIAPALPQAFYL